MDRATTAAKPLQLLMHLLTMNNPLLAGPIAVAPLTDLPQMALADQQTPLPAQPDAQKTLQAEQQHAGVYVPASDETLPIIPPQQAGQAQASTVVLQDGAVSGPLQILLPA